MRHLNPGSEVPWFEDHTLGVAVPSSGRYPTPGNGVRFLCHFPSSELKVFPPCLLFKILHTCLSLCIEFQFFQIFPLLPKLMHPSPALLFFGQVPWPGMPSLSLLLPSTSPRCLTHPLSCETVSSPERIHTSVLMPPAWRSVHLPCLLRPELLSF